MGENRTEPETTMRVDVEQQGGDGDVETQPEPQCCCPCCGERGRREFRCSNFGLGHENPDLLVYNQWTVRPSVLFLIYRLVVSLYFLSVYIYSIYAYPYSPKWKWAIYLTRWMFTVLVFTEVLKTITVIVGYVQGTGKPEDSPVYQKMTHLMKATWVFNNVSASGALVVTIIYWGVVYTGWELHIRNVTTHAINTVYVVIDWCITGIPTRFYHFYQPLAFGVTYSVFTVIYWSGGGLGEKGEPYIYSVINYGSSPGTATGWLFAVCFFAVITHFIHFGVVMLRQFIYRKCRKQPAETEVIEMK